MGKSAQDWSPEPHTHVAQKSATLINKARPGPLSYLRPHPLCAQ